MNTDAGLLGFEGKTLPAVTGGDGVVVAVATRKRERGGNTPVGTPSQLVCHRFESRLGHGGSSPLPADKHSSWERKVLLLAISQFALSFFS
jgi:hypothetical protein